MKDVNKIILIGRLGADPAQKETKSGVSMVTFPLATSRRLEEGDEVVSSGQLKLQNGSHVVVDNRILPANDPNPWFVSWVYLK